MFLLLKNIRFLVWLAIVICLGVSVTEIFQYASRYGTAFFTVLLLILDWRLSAVQKEMVEGGNYNPKQPKPKLPAH